ncbi:carbohydrate-binding protein [Actinoplanes sp. ATCC 53533]|uniref:carbohydrate-binding protein n=1 Tax=Actinoplanes sp. ATCC 53533 TaxID=1288362 RepID=UPI001F2BED3C|nr:carbohydrate-binding protein [Actinoplanes sp. ATCC 53533]
MTAMCGVALLVAALATALPAGPASAAPSQLTVDLSANTGALRYGATGFLYGLGDEGIPNETMLSALRPQVAAQKAPDGLQHPNGDALRVAPMFKRAGGRHIEIYLQDVYPSWPYDNLGLTDYLGKVDTIARKVVADPNRAFFVYVPFNEPDWIWYSGQITGRFLNDWRTVVQRIKSIDPSARIAGPGFTHYMPTEMRAFMTFAKNNNVLPDTVTWHELGDDFFANWDSHYNNYRQIERDLAIGARPITIDEYARQSGDLGVPGNLVQYVAKFEASKVDACLAYWTTAGGLNDLVTRNNQATGGWWLYKWYGELTGNTVAVTPPAVGGSLQGLAAVDSGKQQARVVFGGNNPVTGTYDTNVVVRGLGSAPFLGSTVHATVWGVDSSGQNPSTGPFLVTEGDYAASGGQFTLPLTGLRGSAAYHVIITPNKDLSAAGGASRYQAEYARLDGGARVTYGSNTGYSGTYFTEGYGASSTASTKFVVTVPADGYYNVGLRYSAGPYSGAPANRSIRLRLNGSDLTDLALPGTADWNTWNTATTRVFLPAGVSRLEANAYAGDDRDAVNLDYVDVAATSGTITAYEAEASGNTLSGTAVRGSNSGASGGQQVGFIGAGAGNTLRFNNVTVPTAGRYRMVVAYANAEVVGEHQYNNNIVDRGADISVNGGTARRTYFRNTLSWTTFRTTVVDVDLVAGANAITFGNSTAYAPDIDLIRIAAPIG